MIVGFDISMLAYPGSGVATYTYNLVKNLLKVDRKNEYKLFYSSFKQPAEAQRHLKEFRKLGAIVYSYSLPHRFLNFIWNQHHFLAINRLIGPVDVFHSSDFFRPPLPETSISLTTIHDFTWKVYPQYHSHNIIRAHERKLKKTIKYQDIILVVSQRTKQDFKNFYPRARNKVFVVTEGVSEKFFQQYSNRQIGRVLRKYQINKPYILYVGAIEPRKNINKLIKAFKKILEDHPNLNLILAGRAGLKSHQVFSLIKTLKLGEKVNFVGLVKDKDLPLIYQGAKLFVYPSSYEGFGLPPLEALAGNIPVVAYNCPSVPKSKFGRVISEKLTQDIKHKLTNPKTEKVKILKWEQIAKDFLQLLTSLN